MPMLYGFMLHLVACSMLNLVAWRMSYVASRRMSYALLTAASCTLHLALVCCISHVHVASRILADYCALHEPLPFVSFRVAAALLQLSDNLCGDRACGAIAARNRS